jgi:hypothetical protein
MTKYCKLYWSAPEVAVGAISISRSSPMFVPAAPEATDPVAIVAVPADDAKTPVVADCGMVTEPAPHVVVSVVAALRVLLLAEATDEIVAGNDAYPFGYAQNVYPVSVAALPAFSGVFISSYIVQLVLFVCTFALTALVYRQFTLPLIDGEMLPKLIVPLVSPVWLAHVPAVPV